MFHNIGWQVRPYAVRSYVVPAYVAFLRMMLLCVLAGGELRAQWQRFVIHNRSREPVLVTVDDEGVVPRSYHSIKAGDKAYRFPRAPSADQPLIIRLSSATLKQELTLWADKAPNKRQGMSQRCRSYGELVLRRVNDEVGRVDAPDEDGVVRLVYTVEGDFIFDEGMRARAQRKFSCRPRCSTAAICRSRSCQRPRIRREPRWRTCGKRRCGVKVAPLACQRC